MVAANGKGNLVLRLVLNPGTGKIQMQGPEDLGACYMMLRGGLDMVVSKALEGGAERKVKTLDELGIKAG